eukprot:SM000029S10533  [mRNA]  locus=s29:658219:659113:- [translate_table: standard]
MRLPDPSASRADPCLGALQRSGFRRWRTRGCSAPTSTGLKLNDDRPGRDKLPYGGAWLWVGSQMIHLMELPNPDPLTGRPEHGGRDRHTCLNVTNIDTLKQTLERAGVPYTLSKSGRPALFARDPDGNALEFAQVD